MLLLKIKQSYYVLQLLVITCTNTKESSKEIYLLHSIILSTDSVIFSHTRTEVLCNHKKLENLFCFYLSHLVSICFWLLGGFLIADKLFCVSGVFVLRLVVYMSQGALFGASNEFFKKFVVGDTMDLRDAFTRTTYR
ncbi:unnamed protein product [Amaranthus hypochondriacus]